jgi:squalene-hopene/tetraprenyl-beta-curcumene cyclase
MATIHRFTIVTIVLCPLALPTGKLRAADPADVRWDAGAAAKYLDERAASWLKWSGAARGQGTTCLSCHTTMPFALARPALAGRLGEAAPGAAEAGVIDVLKKRVASWDKIAGSTMDKDPLVPFYANKRKPSSLGTETVLNAFILVNYDARRSKGVLSAPTRKALDHLWRQQQPSGAWLWLDFGLKPWEEDAAYFGAALAAVAAGTAGQAYYDQADIRANVAALQQYLKTRRDEQPLHHRAVALWASARLPGILTQPEKTRLIEELVREQEADGGWSLPKLGRTPSGTSDWKSHSAYPQGAGSDGYATGLAVLALRRGGIGAASPHLTKGIDWLAAHQQEGTWPVHYLNKQRDPHENTGKFMRDAAAAFAILALTDTD